MSEKKRGRCFADCGAGRMLWSLLHRITRIVLIGSVFEDNWDGWMYLDETKWLPTMEVKIVRTQSENDANMFPNFPQHCWGEVVGTRDKPPGGRGTLKLFEWGCAAGILEPLAYTRASSSELCYPILDLTPQPLPPRVAVFQKQVSSLAQSSQNKTDLIFFIYSWVAIPSFPSLD